MNATEPDFTKAKQQQASRQFERVGSWLFALAILGSLPVFCAAEGFRNPPAGTFNLGRAGGRIAQVDDSSAVAQNPANLMDVPQAEGNFTPSIVYLHVDYASPSGQTAHTKKPWKPLPNLFASIPISDDRFTAGFGVTVPYGLSNEWEPTGAFADPSSLRYTAPFYSELKTLNFSPTFSARLHERLTLGVGLDVMWSELTFRQFYPWFLFGGTEGTAQLRGSGIGVGGNIGLTWQPIDRHRIAITYRSPMDITYDGHLNIDNVPAAATALGASSRSEFQTKIKFPTIVALGYGFEVNDKVRVEVDGEWIQFSRFDALNLNAGNNTFLLGGSSTVREDWRDTFTIGIGGDWKFAPGWVFRAGYQFYETPVPDHTFSPSIPDANQNVFTVGLGYRKGHHAVEAAYGLDFYDNRVIASNTANPTYNAAYDITVHLLSFSYRYSF